MKKHLFLVSSNINTNPIESVNDNLARIVKTSKSIFAKVSNPIIAIVDFSPIPLDDNIINPLRDVSNYVVNLSIEPEIVKINQEKHSVLLTELHAFEKALGILENANILKEVDKIHFLKGGTKLNNDFNLEMHEKIEDRISVSAPKEGTIPSVTHQYDDRLWSCPVKHLERVKTFYRSAISEVSYRLDKNIPIDMQHILYYLLPLQECISLPNLGVSDVSEDQTPVDPNAPYFMKFYFHGMGDQISATPIPEIIFRKTGKKLAICDDKIWAYKHNPYVELVSDDVAQTLATMHIIPDSRVQEQREKYTNTTNFINSNGQADYMSVVMGIKDAPLRHPRLYVYEDSEIKPNKIVVHTTGSDRTKLDEPAIRNVMGEDDVRIMSDEVIDSILKNYKHFEIIQVGGADDKPLGGHSIDLRGKLDYWEVAKEISSASRFIGVNSGPMHIANCYPRVDKRIILMEFPKETLLKHQPSDVRNWLFSWLDPSHMYFNKTTDDIGITYSYTKI